MTTHHAVTVSVAIARSPASVYAFVADPTNLPRWAAGFAHSVERAGDDWIVHTADGAMRLRFADRNPYGVLDHDVTAADGTTFHNPMRVVPNGAGSEVLFTLFRLDGTSAERFAEDRRLVEADLRTLQRILEEQGDPR